MTKMRVLIVEDEMVIAMHMEDMFEALGHEVVGIASRLEVAMRLARHGPLDFAVLDINLAGEESFPAADVLLSRGIPFVFTTGYGNSGLMDRHCDTPLLTKPFQARDLKRAIEEACAT